MMKKFILDLLALADSRVMMTMELPVTMTVNKIQRKVNCSTYKYHITGSEWTLHFIKSLFNHFLMQRLLLS